MVKFLINRPIAVLMTFIAILLLGAVAAGMLPVSLMPNVDIPEITVQVERPGVSVRELENTIVRPLRQRLMQVAHLDDIHSETHEGAAHIRLRFKYGSDINYAFIDVNEKVDAAMHALPKDVDRPAIIKASATDLPVFYINVRSREAHNNTHRFMELCEFTNAVIRKRLEQLAEVAMVDVTGQLWPELYLQPDAQRMQSLGLQEAVIREVLTENNITLGSLRVVDGQYQYNIRFSNALRNVEDVRNLYLKANGRILQLKDIAKVGIRAQRREGLFLKGERDALSLAVIKQGDARMEDLKEKVDELLGIFGRDFPELELSLVRDQTGILKFAIDNLQQSLVIGGLLAFLIMFLFLRDFRSPWLIGISIPVSLIISLLFFHLIGLSLNIISLSGLILGVGMMIDNSIIVIDNITQHMQRGHSLSGSCIKGTNEVIRPLISSVLTTCAVFLPLVFISGISGALFYDQAVAVAIGLVVSLMVSVTLLPTFYRLFWLRATRRKSADGGHESTKTNNQLRMYETVYEKGWSWVFGHRKWMMPVFLMLIIIGAWLAWQIKKERFPAFKQNQLEVSIDWNERINLEENKKRIVKLLHEVGAHDEATNAFVGRQQYLMHKDMELLGNEALIYIGVQKTSDLKGVEQLLENNLRQGYPRANISFRFPETIFERLFADREAPFVTRVSSPKTKGAPEVEELNRLVRTLQNSFNQAGIAPVSTDEQLEVRVRPEQLALYEVKQSILFNKLKAALNANQIGVLRSRTLYIPIVLSGEAKALDTIMRELYIPNKKGKEIPLSQLVDIERTLSYKTLYGGKEGEFVPIPFASTEGQKATGMVRAVRNALQKTFDINLGFSGKLLSSRNLLYELLVVMSLALALLYFILAAQFESFAQPLIVLLEVPMDIAGALGLLWIFGGTINLMAMIGIIVMSGIIINDSILKIDTINQMRNRGMGLKKAIETAGRRRLKPILMTSLTTILALLPFLFQNDMGSRLQQPLALTVIGGMILGTLVSLYFIPLCYYYLYRKSNL